MRYKTAVKRFKNGSAIVRPNKKSPHKAGFIIPAAC
jgi:hypothetical protein